MALSAPETLVSCSTTNSTVLYTAPTTYARDLVLTNGATGSGTAFTVFVATGSASVSTTSGFPIPPGQSLVLLGAAAGGGIGSSNNQIYATCVSAATLVVGFASVVSVI